METPERHPGETTGKPNQAVCHETGENRSITSETRTHSPRQPNSTDDEYMKIKHIHIITAERRVRVSGTIPERPCIRVNGFGQRYLKVAPLDTAFD